MTRGRRYYSKACQELLKPADNSRASIEAALVASLTLFAFDSFSNQWERRYILSNASLSLLRLLKEGFTWNEVSGWRSQFGRAGAQIVVETADLYFNDISYPLFATSRGSRVDILDASAPGRSRIYNPMWLKLDPRHALHASEISDLASMTNVERLPRSRALVEVTPTSVQGCHAHMVAWHCWIMTWLITQPSTYTELHEIQRLTRHWHRWLFTSIHPETVERRVMQNRAAILDRLFDVRIKDSSSHTSSQSLIEIDLVALLRLIVENTRLSEDAQTVSPEHVRNRTLPSLIENIRGVAKAVEYVVRRTEIAETRQRAFEVLSLKTWGILQP